MNVEQLDGFFAALISGPESEGERVQPERLRSSIPKFCPALLRASGLRWPLPNWPRVVDHSCDFFRPVESQLAGNACCE